jgi:hypothetical protein
MNIFNIFKTKEEQYYLSIKNMATKGDGRKITISSLRVRIMTIQNVIKDLSEELNVLDIKLNESIVKNEDILVKKYLNEKDDLKLKITVSFKIQNDFKQDFIKGVSLKLNNLIDTEIPSNYEECNTLVKGVERELWIKGRNIGTEKIENF